MLSKTSNLRISYITPRYFITRTLPVMSLKDFFIYLRQEKWQKEVQFLK